MHSFPSLLSIFCFTFSIFYSFSILLWFPFCIFQSPFFHFPFYLGFHLALITFSIYCQFSYIKICSAPSTTLLNIVIPFFFSPCFKTNYFLHSLLVFFVILSILRTTSQKTHPPSLTTRPIFFYAISPTLHPLYS